MNTLITFRKAWKLIQRAVTFLWVLLGEGKEEFVPSLHQITKHKNKIMITNSKGIGKGK